MLNLNVSAPTERSFLCVPKETNQKKGHPDCLVYVCPRSELFLQVVLIRILFGSHFRVRPYELNPNKYLSTLQAQTGPQTLHFD
jgi:hypothetical protein